MEKRDEIDFTVNTLLTVVRTGNTKLHNAVKRREETYDAIQRGEETYRTKWIQDSVMRVVDTLLVISADFDAQYPDECCSAQDLGDILASTIATLRKM